MKGRTAVGSGEAMAFRDYFTDRPFEDRFVRDPDHAVDVIIPILHTNELWRTNLLSIYREIPVNRLLLGDGGCIDDSLTVAREFPRVEVRDHRDVRSLGYSIRRLIEDVQTEWFCYLHSDVFLPEGWFDTMYGERRQFDWFESGQNTLIMVKTVTPTLEAQRAYSGGQMGRKKAFDAILPTIDDDYLYRNEDIILANLIRAAGFRYGKVAEAFCDHQQMLKESPWLRRVRRVDIQVEVGRDEEIRSLMTYVKGIVKYLQPTQSQDLIDGMRINIDRLVEIDALKPGEFPRWVADNYPIWSSVFPASASASPVQVTVLQQRTLADRLRWAPAAAIKRGGLLLLRIAEQLAPRA